MSGALNLIIARGFDSPIQGALNSYNNQRQAQEGIESANIAQQGAMQNQQWQGEDRALEEQARQKAAQRAQEQEALLAMIPEIDARLRANPDDQEARAAAVEIHSRLNPEKASEGISGLLYPKQSGPQSSLGKLGADLAAGRISQADYDAAARKATYIAPQASVGSDQASTIKNAPNGYIWKDPANPAAGVVPVPGGPADPATILPMTPAEKQAKVALDKQQAANNRAFNAYNVGMSNVLKQFEGTETGPIVGRIPAFTEEQQKASGAEAAILPILKSLFRSAGEGVFTDKDQDLLIAMAPTRADRPAARISKINNINQIVAAKLGLPPSALIPEPGQTAPKTFMTKGGATVEILD